MIEPRDMGLPDKFSGWRNGQWTAISDMVNTPHRFFLANLPTGSGKSVCYIALSRLHGGRTLILTSTKGLQDQLLSEFGGMIKLVKGKSAFLCPISFKGYTCQNAPCAWGIKCALKESTCPYYLQIEEAKSARIVVTNYAFWLSNEPVTLGKFDLLIMDEAHDAAQHILDSLSIELHPRDVGRWAGWPRQGTRPAEIMKWIGQLKFALEEGKQEAKKSGGDGDSSLLFLSLQLAHIAHMGRMSNIVVDHRGSTINIDAISAATIAEGLLFRGIPKVVAVSATAARKTLSQLGLFGQCDYREYPSVFPVENRMVYYLPAGRIDHAITDAGVNQWIAVIDNIIESRMTEKGIIHAVSYDQCDRIRNISRYRNILTTHRGIPATDAVAKFKKSSPPSVLVSPSVGTGYDFPDDLCRWQVISKLAFPDGRTLIMKARTKNDPEYSINLAVQSLVQACGRGDRSEHDFCETFIIDSHFEWLIGKYRHLFLKWWLDGLKNIKTVPRR